MAAVNEGAPQGMTEREEEIYRLTVVNRLTQEKIAERLGISRERVGQILREARAKVRPPDLNKVREEAQARHEDIMRRMFELAELPGAPVTAGTRGDVLLDPEDGAIVRDYAGRINALKTALQADKELRALLGADAAVKQEVTGTVKYEIAGLDPDDLK